MWASPWIAALSALFLWWFSTGAILLVVRWAERRGAIARQLAGLLGLPVLAAGIWVYQHTLVDGSVAAAYLAFLSALAIWGWIELAFLTGLITGPNGHRCPDALPEWERFIRAWGTIAYHEMLLVSVMIAMALYGWGAESTVGLWTFVVLFFARVSAKLNLFFGVPRINVEFIPQVLSHLPSHFRIAKLNWVFPVSITALSFAVACWLERLAAVTEPGQIVGFALLSAITALALLEHWLMVVPLPDAKLWRWMLPEPKPTNKKHYPEGPHGL